MTNQLRYTKHGIPILDTATPGQVNTLFAESRDYQPPRQAKRLYGDVYCRDADLPALLCRRGGGPTLHPNRISDWNKWLRQKATEPVSGPVQTGGNLWLAYAAKAQW